MNKYKVSSLELPEAQVSQVKHEKMTEQSIHELTEDQ